MVENLKNTRFLVSLGPRPLSLSKAQGCACASEVGGAHVLGGNGATLSGGARKCAGNAGTIGSAYRPAVGGSRLQGWCRRVWHFVISEGYTVIPVRARYTEAFYRPRLSTRSGSYLQQPGN